MNDQCRDNVSRHFPPLENTTRNRYDNLIDWAIAFAFGVALGTTLALCL